MTNTTATTLTLDRAKAIYREAIDPRASDGEDSAWWVSVHEDLVRVLDARTVAEAAAGLAWWHSDWEWQAVGDSPKAAAARIRSAARRSKDSSVH